MWKFLVQAKGSSTSLRDTWNRLVFSYLRKNLCFFFLSGVVGCLRMLVVLLLDACLFGWGFSFFFLILFNCFFTLYAFAAVVRSINKSGTKSKDSTVQTSLRDPLSCRQRPFTGNFLSDPNFFRFSSPLFFEEKENKMKNLVWFLKKGQIFILVL